MPGPFIFKDYGTFTGPNSFDGNYDYDNSSLEGFWHSDLPTDTSFSLTDVASILYSNKSNYLGHYLFYNSTGVLNLGHSTGSIPTYIRNLGTEIQNGNGIQNGTYTINGITNINGSTTINGNLNVNGYVSWSGSIVGTTKDFDISHPNKENYRLRHSCIEGPEYAVYVRGKLEGSNVIELPDYWDGLVDLETITVHLTPYKIYQELFVETIRWGKQIIIKNNAGGPINCSYTISAKRIDVRDIIVEYEGNEVQHFDLERK
jgi:hypothetical protein